MRITIRNRGPETDTLHVLPTLWFRDTWSWQPESAATDGRASDRDASTIETSHPELGDSSSSRGRARRGRADLLFCENETNVARLYGQEPTTPFPKDGINDHVIGGAPTVNPERTGTKAAAWYRLTLEPGEEVELRLRLRPRDTGTPSRASRSAPRSRG